jgi:hypothetical protein
MQGRLALWVFIAAAGAFGQNVANLYSLPDLRKAEQIYRRNLQGLWNEDFLPRLTPEERTKAGTVALETPLAGPYRHPLEFSADAETKQVTFPIASIKFVDDIAVAFAYYDKQHCDLGPISDYAGALRFQPRAPAGAPLNALGVPATALTDPYVDDVAQKILKSTIFFFFAHEYAHVMYKHGGYNSIIAVEAQRREVEADAFALDVLRRAGVVPFGLTYYFLIASRLEKSPIEFDSLAEYEADLRERATHPVSTERILSIARGIDSATSDFARVQNNQTSAIAALRSISAKLRDIARGLDDRQMRKYLADRAKTVDMASLQRSCQR